MRAQEFINKLRSQGRYSFTTQAAAEALQLDRIPVLNALHRLKRNKLIVSPAKGFYLIVPPEYQAYGCLPAEMFVSDLMSYLGQPYYVGYLSAAQFYGAAHQKPQRFQVVTIKNHPPIHCGRIYIEFIANKNVGMLPTKKFNTAAGTIAVATPEVLAGDLVTAPQHAAGINNVATILVELAENIDKNRLFELAKINPELFWIQRLGYLFEFLKIDPLVGSLEEMLNNKKLHWVRLVSRAAYDALIRDPKWKIIVNVHVEPDE